MEVTASGFIRYQDTEKVGECDNCSALSSLNQVTTGHSLPSTEYLCKDCLQMKITRHEEEVEEDRGYNKWLNT